MFQRLILLAIIGLMLPSLTVAQAVYRWTDENGEVHFGDREPTGRKSERVSVKTGRPSGDSERRSPQEQVEELDKQQAERSRKNEESAADGARRKQREANCETARANLKVIESNARIRVTEDGEQRYLDEEEIAKQKQRFEEIAEENCGEPPASD